MPIVDREKKKDLRDESLGVSVLQTKKKKKVSEG